MALFLHQALVIGTRVSGHIDGVDVRVGFAYVFHHGQTVPPWHFDIGNDHIRQKGVKHLRPGTTIGSRKDLLMIPAKYGFDDRQNDTGIIDNENFHSWLLPCSVHLTACLIVNQANNIPYVLTYCFYMLY